MSDMPNNHINPLASSLGPRGRRVNYHHFNGQCITKPLKGSEDGTNQETSL